MKLSLKYLFLCVLVCTHFCSCMYFQSNSRLRASYSCKPYQHIAANGFEIFDFSPSYFIILENNEMHTKSVVVKKELRLDPTSLKGTLELGVSGKTLLYTGGDYVEIGGRQVNSVYSGENKQFTVQVILIDKSGQIFTLSNPPTLLRSIQNYLMTPNFNTENVVLNEIRLAFQVGLSLSSLPENARNAESGAKMSEE